MTQDITFAAALDMLDGMEAELLERARKAVERRLSLLEALGALGCVPSGPDGPPSTRRGGVRNRNRNLESIPEPACERALRNITPEETRRQEAYLQGIQEAQRRMAEEDSKQGNPDPDDARTGDAGTAQRQEWRRDDVMDTPRDAPLRVEVIADSTEDSTDPENDRLDFQGESNFAQYIQSIGMASAGALLTPGAVAEYLRATGFSRARLPGLTRKVRAQMEDHPHLYQHQISGDHVGTAFRYIGPSLVDHMEHGGPRQGENPRANAFYEYRARLPGPIRRTPVPGSGQPPQET